LTGVQRCPLPFSLPIPRVVVAELPEPLRGLPGYNISPPSFGSVAGRPPRRYISEAVRA